MITRSPKPCSAPASTGRTGQHRGSPARRMRNAGSLVSSAGTIRNTSIARSGSSPPMPDTPARTTNSSLVAPSSTPKPAPPTPRAGHVRSETGRRLATFASTPSATPAATKSETPADRHRTTPLTNTGGRAVVVHAVAGNVDDTPRPLPRRLAEDAPGELDAAGDGGPRQALARRTVEPRGPV